MKMKYQIDQILISFDDFFAKAITEGPAPLIVTPKAPAVKAFFFTWLNPGIICNLAGSKITSFIEFPIISGSFFTNPATIAAALERFWMLSEIFNFFGITL